MKIVFAGISGTGKTTLINALVEKGISKEKIMPSIGRTMMNMGLEINEKGTESTQIEALLITLEQSMATGGLYARSWLDGLVYTKYLFEKGKVSSDIMDTWKRYADRHINDFDYYFYIRPEFEMEEDGVRSTDKEFYERSKVLMEEFVQYYKLEYGIEFHELTGSVEERVEQVSKVLNGKV